MIFVTVGTNEAPFDRLLHAVDELELDEEVVVQHGASSVRPRYATCIESLPFTDLVDHVEKARVVVTHAGVGSILVARSSGRRPVVIPRLQRFGEAVDDHQLAFARRLDGLGLVALVDDPAGLAASLLTPPTDTDSAGIGSGDLERELRSFLTERASSSARA